MAQPDYLTSTTAVKQVLDTTGRWNSTTISNNITEVDDLMYYEMGNPISAMYSQVGEINSIVQRRYYVGEPSIYRIDRVFYGTTSKTELFENTGWKTSTTYGMIRLLTVASGGVTPETTSEVEIWYVPKIFGKMATYRVAKRLLEMVDVTSGGTTSKELETIQMRLKEVEKLLSDRVGLQTSSSVENYDRRYGINRRRIVQDFTRNNYVGSSGW